LPTLFQRLARLWPYARSSRVGLLAALLAAVVTAATEPLVGEMLKRLLDDGFKPGGMPLWVVPVAIVSLFVVRSTSAFFAQYGLAWACNRVVLNLRQAMFARLMVAAPPLFATSTSSGMTNTLVYESQSGANTLAGCLLTLVRDSLILVALLGYLLYLNWQLTLVVALVFPLVAVVVRRLGKRLHRLTVEGQVATDELAYVVEENMLAWRIVRLFGAQQQQATRFFASADHVRRLVMKGVVASATMTPATQILAACALSVVITLAMSQGRDGGTTVGAFVAFVTTLLQLVAPAKHLADVMAPLTRGLAAVERGLDLIDRTPQELGGSHGEPSAPAASAASTTAAAEPPAAEAAVPATAPHRARGEITFAGVGLNYREDTAPALQGISLHINAGETVALVGPSGAGKTTLVHLLPRFLEPTSGSICLDGVPLQQWHVATLRQQFALVSQDVVLFNDTLANNVALGAALSRPQIEAALSGAHLLDFARSLPQGLDTPIGHNGSQLSGGQRQRLAIARAIVKNAPVLILDEATSALDSESERAVQEALVALMKGRTTLVIAHRLSTIEHANRVLVLDAGQVVQQGTHAQLLAQGGLYARLHGMQFHS
jgi:ATP-binding cassette, subfamily B, bacterial MsbA